MREQSEISERRERENSKKALQVDFLLKSLSDIRGALSPEFHMIFAFCKEILKILISLKGKSGGTVKSDLSIHASTNSKEVLRSFQTNP